MDGTWERGRERERERERERGGEVEKSVVGLFKTGFDISFSIRSLSVQLASKRERERKRERSREGERERERRGKGSPRFPYGSPWVGEREREE